VYIGPQTQKNAVGCIFLCLWTKVHLIISQFLPRHCSLQCGFMF